MPVAKPAATITPTHASNGSSIAGRSKKTGDTNASIFHCTVLLRVTAALLDVGLANISAAGTNSETTIPASGNARRQDRGRKP